MEESGFCSFIVLVGVSYLFLENLKELSFIAVEVQYTPCGLFELQFLN